MQSNVGIGTHWWIDVIEVCKHVLVASVFSVKCEVSLFKGEPLT